MLILLIYLLVMSFIIDIYTITMDILLVILTNDD